MTEQVGKLYASLSCLALVFAAAMSFATLAVYADEWWPGVVAGGIVLVFAALGGLLVPGSLRSLSGGRLRTAKAALQLFGSVVGLMFFVMAVITWGLAKRWVGAGNGYTTLGIFIFLGLAGVGVQGVVAMTGYFVHVRNQAIVVPSRLEERAREEARGNGAPAHGRGTGATSALAADVPAH